MGTVPDNYYQFIIDYTPYVYVIPESGPDLTFGKAALAAAFAIDFLTQAYNTKQFEDKQAEIYTKTVSLADWRARGQEAWTKAEELWLKFEKTCTKKSEN